VKTDQPLIGGVLATAGNLLFNGEGNGLFKAFDATTGKELWRYNCGAGVNAPRGVVHGQRQAVRSGGGRRPIRSSTSSAQQRVRVRNSLTCTATIRCGHPGDAGWPLFLYRLES